MSPTDETLPKLIFIDTNFLVALLDSAKKGDLYQRASYLVERVSNQKCKLLVPTPVLSEYLVGADAAGVQSVKELQKKTYVQMAPFDVAAAFECSTLERGAPGPSGDKRDGSTEPWQHIKIDRQIVAIGKTHGAKLFITRDGPAKTAALRSGIEAWDITELPLSPADAQGKLALVHSATKPKKR